MRLKFTRLVLDSPIKMEMNAIAEEAVAVVILVGGWVGGWVSDNVDQKGKPARDTGIQSPYPTHPPTHPYLIISRKVWTATAVFPWFSSTHLVLMPTKNVRRLWTVERSTKAWGSAHSEGLSHICGGWVWGFGLGLGLGGEVDGCVGGGGGGGGERDGDWGGGG